MATPIAIPRLGWSMDEGTFVEWRKHDGDLVKAGDVLFVFEGEKAAEEIETLDAGILRFLPDGPAPGATVVVGQIIGWLVAEGEEPPAASTGQPALATPTLAADRTSIPPTKENISRFNVEHLITPRARRVSTELGVDTTTINGTGKGGRIRARDVRAGFSSAGGRIIPHSQLRRTIAKRMVAGVTEAAPVTLTTKVDATSLVAKKSGSVGYNDLIIAAVAKTLRAHPMLQAQWRDDGLLVPDRIDIALAVDTDSGLLAPVIRSADSLPLEEIGRQSRELVVSARAGTLPASDMRDATFTITNLGMFGIDAFTPIITLPQCAVLGVGRIVKEPAIVGNEIIPRDQVTLSLTFDHRIVDGAPAARFLSDLSKRLSAADPIA